MHTMIYLPEGTNRVSLWFENGPPGLHEGLSWDTNNGRPYHWPVYASKPKTSITFKLENWEVIASGPLVQGESVEIKYDSNKLKGNREPDWFIKVHYKFNDTGEVLSQKLDEPDAYGLMHTVIVLPVDTVNISIWFENGSLGGSGGTSWDSCDGHNYHWEVKPATKTLTFLNNWEQQLTEPLKRGDTIIINYDSRRLPGDNPQCGKPHIKVHYKHSDSVDVRTEDLMCCGGTALMSCTISIPLDATKLTLWFENSGPDGHTFWDSNLGNNYTWPVL
eukprot:TRINITY_DN2939_c0_g1_i1.p1 TRINITY_DN2939_c0_g1~~TRINITY_DN2939_c0_g1_i1.p1  ORF type:complete len:276 (-),score=44.96 TRINITY_DN2939_c0_g1_i1:19-846(-)